MKADPYEEGRSAAAQGVHFNDGCPYTFRRTGVSQSEFDQNIRPLMDQWFAGWKTWLDENGLGFNFKRKNKVLTKPKNITPQARTITFPK